MEVYYGLTAAILINYVILQILFNFIASKKNNKTKVGYIILIALILGGISIGTILIGITQFRYVEDKNKVKATYTFEMNENLVIYSYGDIEYIENDANNVTIICEHSNYYETYYTIINNKISFYRGEVNMPQIINDTITNINNKEIKDYSKYKLYVYSSKENIEKIKSNMQLKTFDI